MKDKGQFLIGADVITYLMPERHPMIMVDRIIEFRGSPSLQLSAERFVSANESVFVGHFSNLKLWPGTHTIEGLRQCCVLLEVLHQLEEKDLLNGLFELQRERMFQPHVDKRLCRRVLDVLKRIRQTGDSPLILRVKLLTPVFAGCIIKYRVHQNDPGAHSWSVYAEVDGRPSCQRRDRISVFRWIVSSRYTPFKLFQKIIRP